MSNYIHGQYQYMASLRVHKEADKSKVKEEKQRDKLYAILNRTGKTLDEVTRQDITENDYIFILEWIKSMGRHLSSFPNLQ